MQISKEQFIYLCSVLLTTEDIKVSKLLIFDMQQMALMLQDGQMEVLEIV